MSDIINKVLFHKRRRVPIIAIPSPDPITLVRDMQLALTANNSAEGASNIPVMVWDVVVGYTIGLRATNEDQTNTVTDDISAAAWTQTGTALRSMTQTARVKSLQSTYDNMGKSTPSAALDLAHEFPDGTVVVIKHVDMLLNGPSGHAVQQAIMNLRDAYANTNRTLILTDNDLVLPECLRNDTIVIDDSLPTRQQYVQSINIIAEAAGAEVPEDMNAVVDAVAGLPRFQAEQALALSLSRDTRKYDLPTLWAEKKKLVDQTRGLSVHYQGAGFESVGGLRGIKDYFTRLMRGPKPPQLIVWIDEIEKSGIAHTNDTNGINADALGLLLSHIEDHNSYCVSLTGLPGTGKSLVAKTVGAQFGRLVIRMDMGAMKGAYVGESEGRLRAALRLISALSQDNALFIATSNTVNALDTALRSRFVDTFYFPLPTEEDLKPVWDIHKEKYEFFEDNPISDGWVCRNVKQCVEKAYRLGMTLEEAANTIIPTGVAMAKDVKKLNEQANGRFLNASNGETYTFDLAEIE